MGVKTYIVSRLAVMVLLIVSLPGWSETLDMVDEVQTFTHLADTIVNLSGQSELHLSQATDPLTNCQIHLNSADAWLFFDRVRPSDVIATYLGQVDVNDTAAAIGDNCRVVQYLTGAVVIPQGPDFKPLVVFTDPNFAGTSLALGLYTVHNNFHTRNGDLNEDFSSFTLKRGYMATLADNKDGTGFSKVYVAQDCDVLVRQLPPDLDNAVSFIRVLPWRWVGKKGWSGQSPGGATDAATLACLWRYDWDNAATSTLDVEYVPMRSKRTWPSYENINSKKNSTHVLAFNEIDSPDQHKDDGGVISPEEAIAMWPNFLASGLRLGSPSTTDGGLSWLYDFIDQADALHYRVDFVAVHYYQGCQSAASFRNWLAAVHDRTGRPLWVTEFNNGANWTGCTPTLASNATQIGQFIDMLDKAPFVERYAIFNWVGDTRRLVYDSGGLTPAGKVYRDNASPMAYVQKPNDGTGGRAVYQFEGNARDSSGDENHGILVGDPGFVTGVDGNGLALDLDGQADYVVLPDNLTDTHDFTLTAWVNWSGGSSWQRIFDFGDGTDHYMFLTPKSGSGSLRFAISTNSYHSEEVLETSALSVGQWTNVAVVLEGNQGRLYVDGNLVDQGAIDLNPSDLDATANYLGRSQFAADPLYRGQVDDVRILDQALSSEEIISLVGSGSHLPERP